ncbi:MAG: dihydroorotase [Lentisphaerales bacterium]|nr:dihydroorotase [Lentisphaerales bacterium]
MSKKVLIKNAQIVNEGQTATSDVLIINGRIERVDASISSNGTEEVIDASGLHLLPGMIDDQVHFREPGLTHKGNIASESRAAVAGGITSFMEMPNVNPSTTTIEALEKKFDIARESSAANYSFYLGATEENVEEIKRLDPTRHCGVKVFMGASTGNLLVEDEKALEEIFAGAPTLIVTHCEKGPIIAQNQERLTANGRELVIQDHPVLRDAAACYASSSYAVSLAEKYASNLHVLHITTKKELDLFQPGPVLGKAITAEACVHHLWFCDEDYTEKGNLIKCNPAVKSPEDRAGLIAALSDGRIDIIATDHAPHTWEEKQTAYPNAPAGLPLVQHALPTLFDQVKNNNMTLEQVVEKTAHNPAIRYGVVDRGYIREGYFADLVLVDLNATYKVSAENILYHCGWSPFDGHTFSSKIMGVWVNGQLAFDGKQVVGTAESAKRLEFTGKR